jgi:hypothetical protein
MRLAINRLSSSSSSSFWIGLGFEDDDEDEDENLIGLQRILASEDSR